jgi:hypothetical protein
MTYEECKELENKMPGAFAGIVKSEYDLENTCIMSLSSSLYTRKMDCFIDINSTFRLSELEPQEYLDFAKLNDVLLKIKTEQERMEQIEQDFSE